jgi:6-phosphogluconolactonase (cycloisomerase 2 family)
MKFRKFGRVFLASVVSLGLAFGITACGTSNTIDFLFVTASANNNVAVFTVDSLSGSLVPIPDSPYSSGGRNPVAEVTSPNGKNLYVVNHDDNTLVQFGIGTDGKLYPQNTYNTPGTEPTAVAINTAGTFLFVVDNFQPHNPAYTDLNPGPGAVVVYPITTSGSLGTPVANGSLTYFPVCNSPAAVDAVSGQSVLYVVNRAGCGTGNGAISAFTIGSDGTLTAAAGSPFGAGVSPSSLASDPTGKFLYVTDSASNELINFTIQSTGVLVTQPNGPTKTDVAPDAVTVDPRGFYIYVANFTAGTVNTYSIDQSTGNPSGNATFSTAVDTGPTAVLVEPALGRYVYTSNFLDATVSGLQLNPSTGSLIQTQTPAYHAPGQPSALAAITHGNHSIQTTQK